VFPTPSYSKFATLQMANEAFVEYLSELMMKHTLYMYCVDWLKTSVFITLVSIIIIDATIIQILALLDNFYFTMNCSTLKCSI